MNILIEMLGFYGMFAALVAFGLITKGIVTARSLSYQLLNLTGGIALCYYSFVKTAWASVVLNVAWILIAIYGLYVIYTQINLRK